MLALLLARQVDVVVRQHQCRQTDFRLGRRLGKEDHVVLWLRPQRPVWIDEETYAVIPPILEVRELKVRVEIRGFRVKQLVVVTTLTDAQRYPKSEMAGLFRQRWHAEPDLRNIKCLEPVGNGNSRSFELGSHPERGGYHECPTTTLWYGPEGNHSQEVSGR